MERIDYPLITLKAARVNAGFSQKQAAKSLGINTSTLQNYEKGETIPDWNMVEKISNLYEFPKDYIFFGKKSALSGICPPKTA